MDHTEIFHITVKVL